MSVLVIAEHEAGILKASVARTVGAARFWHQPIDLLVIAGPGNDAIQEAVQLSHVNNVLVAQAERFLYPLDEDIQDVVLSIAQNYSVVIAAHSVLGKCVIPALAAKLDVAPVTNVTEISVSDDGSTPVYIRPEYAGNILSYIESPQTRQLLTVHPVAFTPVGREGNAQVHLLPIPPARNLSHWLEEETNPSDRPDLSSARVVIAGGRSLGPDFEALLAPVAKELNAAIGATRACVDVGYAPNDLQVGQTGTVIAPELYIAVGISGAMQHIAGIKDSRVIVAINHDPNAPIFNYADYGLVADLFTALPQLHNALAGIKREAA